MAAYDTLRAAIDSYIKANGNNEITGEILNDILNAMVSALGADTRFAGVAVPSTNPGNPEGNVVYFASQAGTYSNFGGIVLQLGIHILVWNGTTWTSQTWFSVDNTPTQSSQNLATSGGILQSIVDAVGIERLRAIGVEVTSCSFDSTTKKISFFNSANTTLFQLDATAFIIDGMVSEVKIEDGKLIIQFNTDAGKQDIEIPLTDIFNPANYYTKTAIDTLLASYYTKTETDTLLTAINNKLADGCLYRGMAEPSTNPPTPTTKVFYIATKAGTYTNFGNIAVTDGITILKYDGSNWSKEQISYSDGVFDISAYNGTSYADLSAALGTNGANIPQNLRKGGMSIKFVQSSDNNYVQCRYIGTEVTGSPNPFLDTNNWISYDILYKERRCYTISGTYSRNSVQIEKIWLLEPTDAYQSYITVNDTFTFGSIITASEYLVLTPSNTVTIKSIMQINKEDCILLAWGRVYNDYYWGALYDDYLYHKTTETNNLTNELAEKVEILEKGQAPLHKPIEIDGYLSISSPYEFKSNDNYYGGLIDISAYKGRTIKVEAVRGDVAIAFLQNNNLTIGQTPDYSVTYNTTIVLQNGESATYIIAPDCNYFYTYVRSGDIDKTPTISIEQINKSIIVNLRIGAIARADGKPWVGYGTRLDDIKKLMLADNYIELEAGDIISVSGIDSSETLGYACFDSNFNLFGLSPSVLSGTKYVRLYCSKSENRYTHNSKNVTVSVKRNHDIEINCVKCGNELATNGIIWFTYPIRNVTYANDTGDASTYEGDNTDLVLNNGYVILPPNYSRNGKPCPIVVHCHGTGGVTWRKSEMPYLTYNQDYLNFIAKNGYIVIGCSTTTELYAQQYRDADIATPLTYSAYVELFRYVIDNFNADVNNVSIFGYSAGGIMSNMLARLQPFKISCVASLAGSLDYATNGRVVAPMDGDVNILGNTLNGIPTENQPGYFSSLGQNKPMDSFMIARFIQYKDNVCGLSPLFFGLTGVEISDMMQQMYSTKSESTAYDNNQDLQALVDAGKIICNVPTKIWHAIDDENVPYAISKYYVDMIHRAGGYAKLRTFPAGCGKHYAVGNSTNTTNVPFMDYVTVFGETVNVPVAYGELVDWFNKWNN